MDIKNSSELIEAIDSGSDTAEHNLTKQASQIIQCESNRTGVSVAATKWLLTFSLLH